MTSFQFCALAALLAYIAQLWILLGFLIATAIIALIWGENER